jgi:hypothetical protein
LSEGDVNEISPEKGWIDRRERGWKTDKIVPMPVDEDCPFDSAKPRAWLERQ